MINLIKRVTRGIRRRVQHFFALRRARQATRERLAAGQMKNVLVVCYGNIYRSPFAARLLRDTLADAAEIRSAGFHQQGDRRSPERHIAMSRELGVDLEPHRSRVVSAEDIEWADTIVLMDRFNWEMLQTHGADPAKYVWLGCLDGGEPEIPDPYSMSEDKARQILARLKASAAALGEAIRAARATVKP